MVLKLAPFTRKQCFRRRHRRLISMSRNFVNVKKKLEINDMENLSRQMKLI
jgi:hypothetical protein